MNVKKKDYAAVVSFRFPDVVLWHITCPKFSGSIQEASHLTRLWPDIVNRHLALLSQEFDSRHAAFSEVLAKRLFGMHWVEQSPSGDAMYSHPSSHSVFPAVSCFVTWVLLLFIRAMMGFSVDAAVSLG